MSQQDFERTDQEVMDLVNGAASPEAKERAEAIEKELNKPREAKSCDSYDEVAAECVSRVVVEEMHRKWKLNTIIACSLQASACIVAALALVIALKKPECMVYIVNVIVLGCGIVAALRVEKIIKLLRK